MNFLRTNNMPGCPSSYGGSGVRLLAVGALFFLFVQQADAQTTDIPGAGVDSTHYVEKPDFFSNPPIFRNAFSRITTPYTVGTGKKEKIEFIRNKTFYPVLPDEYATPIELAHTTCKKNLTHGGSQYVAGLDPHTGNVILIEWYYYTFEGQQVVCCWMTSGKRTTAHPGHPEHKK